MVQRTGLLDGPVGTQALTFLVTVPTEDSSCDPILAKEVEMSTTTSITQTVPS